MRTHFAAYCCALGLGVFLFGCNPGPAPKVDPVVKTDDKIVPDKPKAIGQPADLTPKTVTSVTGSFTMTLPVGWFGTDVSPEALEASAARIGQVSPALAETVKTQGTNLGQSGGTILGFDVRPAEVQYGYSSNLSGFTQDVGRLNELLKEAEGMGTEEKTKNTYNTPLGKIIRMTSTQNTETPNGYKYRVAHFIYIIQKPKDKRLFAFRFSCVKENEKALEPQFKKSIESIEFLN